MAHYVDYLGEMLTRKDEEFRSFLHYTSRNVQRSFTSELDASNYLGSLNSMVDGLTSLSQFYLDRSGGQITGI